MGHVAEQTSPGAVAIVLATGIVTHKSGDCELSLSLAGRSLVSWTFDSLMRVPEVVRTILVTRTDAIVRAEVVLREFPDLDVEIIEGGRSRHHSERRALQHLARDIHSGAVDVVLVHDADRPLCRPEMMRAAITVAREVGGAVPALEGSHLVRLNPDGSLGTLERGHRYVRLQTPQAFRALPLLRAYEAAARVGYEAQDTHSSVQRFSDLEVRFFQGEERNMRVASADDLLLAERLLAKDRPGLG